MSSLKDRIAAIEQRNNSAAQRATSPPPPLVSTVPASPSPLAGPGSGPSALRDKIARFEKKGGVPVPRGSFGLGAPPPQESLLAKKRDLYGNRIPGPNNRVPSGGNSSFASLSRPTSPAFSDYSPRRSISLSAADFDDENSLGTDGTSTPVSPDESFSSPPRSFSPIANLGINRPPIRGVDFSAALEAAKKAETSSQLFKRPPSTTPDNEAASVQVQPSQPEAAQAAVKAEENAAPPAEPSVEVPPAIIVVHDEPEPTASVPEASPAVVVDAAPVSPPQGDPTSPPVPSVTITLSAETRQTPSPSPSPSPSPIQSKPQEVTEPLKPVEEDPTTPTAPSPSPSPLRSRPPSSIFSQPTSLSPIEESDPDVQEIVVPARPLSTLAKPVNLERPEPRKASSSGGPTVVVPVKAASSPVPTKGEASPNDATPTPTATAAKAASAVSTSTPATGNQAAVSAPTAAPTTVKTTTTVRKISQPKTYVPPQSTYEEPDLATDRTKMTTFKAVVHRKTREPSTTSTTVAAPIQPPQPVVTAPSQASTTPQISRVRSTGISTKADTPASPGYGELAVLLEEAAVLELALQKGELPGEPETSSQDDHTTEDNKANGKQDLDLFTKPTPSTTRDAQPAPKSRSHFRNPLSIGRNKPAHRKSSASLSADQAQGQSQQQRAKSAFMPDYKPLDVSFENVGDSLGLGLGVISQEPSSFGVTLTVDGASSSGHGKEVSNSSRVSIASAVSSTGGSQQQHENGDFPPTPPRPKYFSGLRRLASASEKSGRPSTSSYQSGHYNTMPGRNSLSGWSEISSDDSAPVVTPMSDNVNEFGGIRGGAGGSGSTVNGSTPSLTVSGSNVAWPNLSPKKSGGSLTRAATFAEKLWSRGRTKSSASSMSTSTNVLSDRLELLPPIPSTSTITVSITPASPGTSPLGSDQTTPTNSRGSGPSAKTADHFIVPPARSSSLLEGTSIRQRPHTSGGNPTNGYSTFTSSFHRQVPPSSFPTSINSNPVNDQQGIRPPPPPYSTAATGASGMSRPTSWMSASSAGSAPSPLFEKELFDAFPNVPQAIPAGPARRLGAVSEDARMKYASAGPSSLGTAGPSASNVGRSTTLPRLR